MRCAHCGAALCAVAAALLSGPVLRRSAYEATGLAPYGGGVVKDLTAYALCCLPRLGRLFKAPPSPGALESFHDTLQYGQFGAQKKFKDSPHFAENFYFWANSPGDTSFVYTTRLSFFGVDAANIHTLFHFLMDGEAWDLPEDFIPRTSPHRTGDPVQAVAPGVGTLAFDCEVPMQRWRVRYSGLVRSMRSGEKRNVTADFRVHFNPRNAFMYQLHWDELTAARAMAAKEWTASFWENLRAQNQERYASQADRVAGSIQFEGHEERQLQLDGSRDHNFGIRNWRFIHSYIWFPPNKFNEPIEIEGIKYTYLTGAMTMYGNCFDNLVCGGLMSDDGECASWSAATPMREIAPEWFDAKSVHYKGIAREALKHGSFDWEVAILQGRYTLSIHNDRGPARGMWVHTFMFDDGAFEVHEAQTLWTFTLRAAGSPSVLQTTTAIGLLEFGKNLVGYDDSV